MKEPRLPYTQSIIDKVKAEIKKIEVVPSGSVEFDTGCEHMKKEILKKLATIEI